MKLKFLTYPASNGVTMMTPIDWVTILKECREPMNIEYQCLQLKTHADTKTIVDVIYLSWSTESPRLIKALHNYFFQRYIFSIPDLYTTFYLHDEIFPIDFICETVPSISYTDYSRLFSMIVPVFEVDLLCLSEKVHYLHVDTAFYHMMNVIVERNYHDLFSDILYRMHDQDPIFVYRCIHVLKSNCPAFRTILDRTHPHFAEWCIALDDIHILPESFWLELYNAGSYMDTIRLDHSFYFYSLFIENMMDANLTDVFKEVFTHQAMEIMNVLVSLVSKNKLRNTLDPGQLIDSFYVNRDYFDPEDRVCVVDCLSTLFKSHTNPIQHVSMDMYTHCKELVQLGIEYKDPRLFKYSPTQEKCIVTYEIPKTYYMQCTSNVPHIIDYEVYTKLDTPICPYCRQEFDSIIFSQSELK